MLKEFRNKIRGYVPFTGWWLVWRKLDKDARSILDVGCGTGKPMQFFNRHKQFYTVGIDGFEQCVKQCRREKSHDVVLCGDIKRIPYKERSFDVVICLQVLEHLDKEDGRLLLRQMERIARRQVILATDINGFVPTIDIKDNPLQEHRYLWGVDELREEGFTLHGAGLRGWGGKGGYFRLLPEPFRWLASMALQFAVAMFVYYKPKYAGAVVCIKNIGGVV